MQCYFKGYESGLLGESVLTRRTRCADYKLQERQLEEQRRLMAALHSRNCMLTALNSNLIMQLNLLRSIVPLERRESRSLHLRIALPGGHTTGCLGIKSTHLT